ncbi:hypothetical protein J5X84_08140 [Streptosporangiaceae bacterium NEAU-GS5]|nr:hypothetical protein [Streptosporangiaceae bacterium NEAU-GS5]
MAYDPDEIRLMPDYSASLPLWGAWQEAEFSPELLDRLSAWQEDFDANFHWETGWRSVEARDRWAAQAAELEAELRAELGGARATLTVDLWPLEADSPS